MKSMILSLVFMLGVSCASLDDQLLSKAEFKNIEFKDFQINLDRDYINTRVVNNSSHTVTSCIFRFSLYKSGSTSTIKPTQDVYVGNANTERISSFIERTDIDSLAGLTHLLSHNFFIRETLKPGYSTEVYFEINLDFEQGQYIYTKELVELKGS
ncbi:MAG: hypothetical protein HQ507_00190 [Candidatus Marinimicrobia bacterium]|nr:hypothetical protein [Candidatus Neomarinimicrobiota bacterium]